MHTRMILKDFGLRQTRLYELFEIIYLAIYMVARGFFIPFTVCPYSVLDKECPWSVCVVCVSMGLLGLYYVYQYNLFYLLSGWSPWSKEKSRNIRNENLKKSTSTGSRSINNSSSSNIWKNRKNKRCFEQLLYILFIVSTHSFNFHKIFKLLWGSSRENSKKFFKK